MCPISTTDNLRIFLSIVKNTIINIGIRIYSHRKYLKNQLQPYGQTALYIKVIYYLHHSSARTSLSRLFRSLACSELRTKRFFLPSLDSSNASDNSCSKSAIRLSFSSNFFKFRQRILSSLLELFHRQMEHRNFLGQSLDLCINHPFFFISNSQLGAIKFYNQFIIHHCMKI